MNARPRDNFRVIVAVIWLVGLAALVEARWIWPGVLFLGGITALVASKYRPERRHAGRAGLAMIVLGIWATMRFTLPALLIGLGTAIIIAVLLAEPPRPKPEDNGQLDLD